MAKRYLILLIAAVMLLTVGCVSDKEYKELEERVSFLESLHGVSHNDIPDETEQSEDVSSMQSVSTDNYIYDISSLSTDEIVKDCMYYFGLYPSQGQFVDDFEKSLKLSPASRQFDVSTEGQYYYSKGYYFYYYKSSNDTTPTHDAICSIFIGGLKNEMDGSIGIVSDSERNNYPAIDLQIYIINYDRAAELYEKLSESLKPYYSSSKDSREGTYWSCKAGNLYDSYTFLSMEKKTDYYEIILSVDSTLFRNESTNTTLNTDNYDKVLEESSSVTSLKNDTKHPSGPLAIAKTGGLRIKSEANTDSEVIAQLSEGESVAILDNTQNDEWIKVDYNGDEGYIYSEYVDIKYPSSIE